MTTNIIDDKAIAFLNPTKESNAKIVFDKIPHFEFQTQKFSIPGMNVGTVQLYSRTGDYSRPGEKIQFQKPWTLEIILDEKYIAFREIANWIFSYAKADVTNESDEVNRDFTELVSDARVIILDNQLKEVGAIVMKNCYPIGISSISYSTTDSSYEYIKFNADFDYSSYEFDFL